MVMVNNVDVWALDIETSNWTELVLYKLTNKTIIYTGYTVEKMVKDYCKVPANAVVISHNGGRFDFLPLLDGLQAQWNITLANGIINMRAKGYAYLLDSYRLFVLSLDKWTNRKTKLPFKCNCQYKCGGYCRINKNMTKEEMKILEDYCINDCFILLDYYKMHLEKLAQDGFQVFNKSGTPRATIGAVAYNTAKAWCGLPDGTISHGFYKLTKNAFYGGRTEAFSKKSDHLYLFDINSAYPAEQLKPLPVGQHRELFGREALQAYIEEKAGLYYIKAYQDACNMPVLPRRMPKNNRVVWATGHIEGLYVLREAQLAEQECRFFEITRALVWDQTEAIYKPYIEKTYELRQKYKKAKDNYEHVLKIMLNSLYGKLAQNTNQSSLHYFANVDDTPDTEFSPRGVTWEPIHGTKYWVKTQDNVVPENAKPWQAAYITGNVRANMFNFAKQVEEHIAYIDTDCIYTRERITNNLDNTKLGSFKFEGEAFNWRCIGPKVYNYQKVDEIKKENRDFDTYSNYEMVKYLYYKYDSVYKAKGLPFISGEKFDEFLAGETIINDRGVNGIISSLKREHKAFTRRSLKRTNNSDPQLLGTRFVTGDETSVPLHIEKDALEFVWPGREEKPIDFHSWLKLGVDVSD